MSLTIDALLAEADEIIEKKASPVPQKPEVVDEEVTKLANFLMDDENFVEPPKPELEVKTAEQPLVEKIAHALAITHVIANLDELTKIAEFQQKSLDAGYTEDQVIAFLEKNADGIGAKLAKLPWKWIERAGLVGAGGAGAVAAHKKGKEKGYGQAVTDVESLLSMAPKQQRTYGS